MHFITGSQGKFNEVKALMPDIEQLNIDLPEVQSTDPKEIIHAKLQAAVDSTECIVEDTGLYLDCLNGLPGPLVKWFIEKLTIRGIADLAHKYENQRAHATTWIGYRSPSGTVEFFEGKIPGVIVSPRGEGFGWDAIFQPDGYAHTFGEMTREEKNSMSMRKLAVEKLQIYLQELHD